MTDSLLRALDQRAASGRPARLWWRDDDTVQPTPALDRLLDLTRDGAVPVTLAVIPAHTGQDLADRLAGVPGVAVAVHGWAHLNHAPPAEKKQELGPHRPVAAVLAELAQGHAHLSRLHGAQFTPVLVPPWNRISPQVTAGLPALGFKALSVFGPEGAAPLPLFNTHVDVMDWHGTRGGRPDAVLLEEMARAISCSDAPVGLLTHHLVHDAQVWGFLERLFALTLGHPGCIWRDLPGLVGSP